MRDSTGKTNNFWIGLTDEATEGDFAWESGGRNFSESFESRSDQEDCAFIANPYDAYPSLDDASCANFKTNFVCQKRNFTYLWEVIVANNAQR